MTKSAEATNITYPPIDSVEAMNNELGKSVPSEAAGMTISVVESGGDRQTAGVPKPSEVFGNKTQASEPARAVTPVNLPHYPGPDPRSRRATSEQVINTPVPKMEVQDLPRPVNVPKLVPGELVAITTSNHARRVYRIDENGKKRAVSQDTVKELYGKADDHYSDTEEYKLAREKARELRKSSKAQKPQPKRNLANLGGGVTGLEFEKTGVVATNEEGVAATRAAEVDASKAKATTDTTSEQTKLARRLARAKLVGKSTLRLIDRLALAGEKLDTRVGKWAVQKTNGTKLQDKLVHVKEQGTQKGKDIAATSATQLEKAKQKRSALWVRIHERRTELSKSTHNFGEKTTDVFNRHRFTAGVLAGILLVGGAVMATSGSDSNEHAKDRVIAGSTPQHDTNKLGDSIFAPPNIFAKPAPETAVAPQPTVEDNLDAAKKRMAEINATPITKAAPTVEAIAVHQGDRPWNALQSAGIPADQIMQRLDAAAKKSGLKYAWHGSGTHKWIEVEGHSDTKTVMNDLDKFIQR